MGEKLVIDYTGLNIKEVQKLPLDIFYFFRREAFIYKLSQTEDGKEYLENCWRITQTAPDRQAIRDRFSRKEE